MEASGGSIIFPKDKSRLITTLGLNFWWASVVVVVVVVVVSVVVDVVVVIRNWKLLEKVSSFEKTREDW